VAKKLAQALSGAEGRLASAKVEGAFIHFTAVTGGKAGAFDLYHLERIETFNSVLFVSNKSFSSFSSFESGGKKS
jgi:hypothetical protein